MYVFMEFDFKAPSLCFHCSLGSRVLSRDEPDNSPTPHVHERGRRLLGPGQTLLRPQTCYAW